MFWITIGVIAMINQPDSAWSVQKGTVVLDNEPIQKNSVALFSGGVFPQFRCSGIIIDKDLVITAAHCFRRGHAIRQLRFGTYVAAFWGAFASSRKIKSYSLHKRADLALVHFQGELPPRAQPAILPTSVHDNAPAEGQVLVSAGYGYDENSNLGVLKKREVLLKSNWDFINDAESYTIDEMGTCPGDSGSGNFLKFSEQNILIGIVHSSSPFGCADNTFTKILPYLPWIQEQSKQFREQN